MKKLFIIMAMALMVSVQAFAKPYNVPSFNKLNASGIYQVELVKGSQCRVDVTSSPDLADKIKVEVKGGTLYLSLKPNTKFNKTTKNSWVKATVVMPEVNSIVLSGVSSLSSSDKFQCRGEFRLDVSGSSKLSALQIDAPSSKMEISGAANASLSGKIAKCGVEVDGAAKAAFLVESSSFNVESSGSAQVTLSSARAALNASGSGASTTTLKDSRIDNLVLELSGASSFKGGDSFVEKASVEMSGASQATINVGEKMNAQLSGASKLSYSAPSKAAISTNTSGASKVTKK